MASESRLYTFSQETKQELRKFRLGTSRSNDPQAKIYQIKKDTLEVLAESSDVYRDLTELGDELPDNTPRFILLSHPLELPSGRMSCPYVMLYYMPATCTNEMRMLYAGAKQLMANTAEVNKTIDIDDAEDLESIKEKLGGAE